MARLKAANNAITKLTVGITAADTSFTVEDAALFPDAPFRVTIDAEIMQVEAIDKLTNTFSAVQRGIEGTVAAPHNNGAAVANRWTAGYLETLATLEESQAMATTAESEAKTHAEAYADDVAATAETSAKTHATGLVGTLSSLLTTAKDNIVAAINEIFAGLGALETDVAAHKAETTQAHNLSTLLANKVTKPSSAVSGRIAVFDGEAGKIKDGGKTINDIPALVQGRWENTTSSVPADGTLRKYIPTGLAAKKGRIMINGAKGETGGIILFNTSRTQTMYFGHCLLAGSARVITRSIYGKVLPVYDDTKVIGTGIGIKDCYISGTDIVIVFYNARTSAQTLSVGSLYWEVES